MKGQSAKYDGRPLLEQIIDRSPPKSLLETLLHWHNRVFTEDDEHRGLPNTEVVSDAGMAGIGYIRKTSQPCIVITKNWWTILRNGADCMALIRLRSAIRQDEWIENRKAGVE